MLNLRLSTRRAAAALALTFALVAPAHASDFLGLDPQNTELYDLNNNLGTATNLGPITSGPMFGFSRIDRAPDGTVYGISPGVFNGYTIYTIDEVTLVATAVHTVVSTTGGGQGFAIHPSGNTAWVLGYVGLSLNTNLDEVDLATGIATNRGSGGDLMGLAFDSASNLYSARPSSPYANLILINQSNAAASTTIGQMTGVAQGFGIDLASAVYLPTISASANGTSKVFSIDTATGAPTLIATHAGGNAVRSIAQSIGAPLLEFCNGDGGNQMGCTNCPCSNNATAGTIGGCMNSAMTSARLIGSGDTSISLPTGSTSDLRFGMTGVPPGAFCILNSGDAIAPSNMANPCFGMNSGAQSVSFDGLRCAITNTRRHGGRSADVNGDVGVTNNPWGGEGGPPVGLAQAGAGFAAGQTRNFQVINRDDALAVCMRGLNTSQAVQVTFGP